MNHLPRHCERSEAIQNTGLPRRTTVLLAMTFLCIALLNIHNSVRAEDYCDNVDDNAELINCGHTLHIREDAAMTLVYNQLIKKFKQEDKEYPINGLSRSGSREESLREAQRAWIKFRDKNCTYETLVLGGGGTISGSLEWGCLTALTKSRALELQKILNIN